MSPNFSLHKSATSFSLLFVGVTLSLLAAPFLPTTARRVEQSAHQLATSSPHTPELAQPVNPTEILLGLAAVGGGAAVIIASAKKANQLNFTSPKSQKNAILIDQASPQLRQKLVKLLHNDRDTANRLVARVKLNNPNRSINWYVEKAIYDLERDRGR